ncbi:MAG: type III PLP-dependent enzyme [Chloroflexi bacterium]|nr:type III PLP-dependent enzyme [Chloroflexota bacterium]
MNTEVLREKKARAFEKARRASEVEQTPLLAMDAETMRQAYAEFTDSFGDAGVYYAVKANSDPCVVRMFHELGAGFEVGSEGTMRLMLDLGIPASRIVSGNSLKTPAFLKMSYSLGVRTYTFDSRPEVDKMAVLAPGSNVYVRIAVSNNYSEWPLDKKFGIEPERGVELLLYARQKGLHPVGIAFHVGSQCINPAGWTEALEQTKKVWDEAVARGLELVSLNLGGGFPSEYTKPVPAVPEIARAVKQSMGELFPKGTGILLEPGRGLVGDAGVMVTTVIAKADREGKEWLYLDAGVFNGLMESIGGIHYPFRVLKAGASSRLLNYVVAGPSCDSMDVLPGNVELPELETGDRVFILTAGAYTTAYASRFDGVDIPKVILV